MDTRGSRRGPGGGRHETARRRQRGRRSNEVPAPCTAPLSAVDWTTLGRAGSACSHQPRGLEVPGRDRIRRKGYDRICARAPPQRDHWSSPLRPPQTHTPLGNMFDQQSSSDKQSGLRAARSLSNSRLPGVSISCLSGPQPQLAVCTLSSTRHSLLRGTVAHSFDPKVEYARRQSLAPEHTQARSNEDTERDRRSEKEDKVRGILRLILRPESGAAAGVWRRLVPLARLAYGVAADKKLKQFRANTPAHGG